MDAATPHRFELTLTVWHQAGTDWHARVVLADATELEFRSPFELARFLSWPMPKPPASSGGLR
jgi:hypothetical protein